MDYLYSYDNFLNEGKYWMGVISGKDDFGDSIEKIFIDGKTKMGPWGIMTPKSWQEHGVGKLGTGYGQKYEKQEDGKWLKIEGQGMKNIMDFQQFSINEGYYDDPDFQDRILVSNFKGFNEGDSVIRKEDPDVISGHNAEPKVGVIHHIWKDKLGDDGIYVVKFMSENGTSFIQKLRFDEIEKKI